jgi:hypothetical protein
MASVDRRRMADHSVCKRDPDLWTDSFDLCINSACFSVRQAARMIENAYRQISVRYKSAVCLKMLQTIQLPVFQGLFWYDRNRK